MVAVKTNLGNTTHPVYVNEAKKAGGTILPPCVNRSNLMTTIHGTNVYLGFIHIKSLDHNIAQIIETESWSQRAFLITLRILFCAPTWALKHCAFLFA